MASWSLSFGFLERGASVTVDLTWPRGRYEGPQVIQARPIPHRGDAFTFIALSGLQTSLPVVYMDYMQRYTYRVTITNAPDSDLGSDVDIRGGAP